MDTPKETEQLLRRFLADNCSPSEVDLVIELLKSDTAEDFMGPLYEEVWEKLNFKPLTGQHSRQLFLAVKAKVGEKHERKLSQRFGLWKVAASIALALGLGFVTISQLSKSNTDAKKVAQVVKSTAEGQKATFHLSDGTKVKLNAGSTLTFDSLFDQSRRHVNLEGEAFFEVTKEPGRPFVITSGSVTTTVLGTSFNVNALKDEVIVTVATGSVKVEAEGNKLRQLILQPGQQAIYSHYNKSLSLKEVEIGHFLAWKDGVIDFVEANEAEVFRQLSKWYGVQFDIKGDRQIREWNINARYENKSLEFVLKSLGYAVNFDFEIKEKNVAIVYKNQMPMKK